jgi:hypothetical protein
MNKILAFQQIFGDAVIIDQPARRFPEGRVFSSGLALLPVLNTR